MENNKISIFKTNKDLYLNFKNNSEQLILITGITGSGKSTLAKELSLICDYKKISLDLIFGYELTTPTTLERDLLNKFQKKYPEWNLKLFETENNKVFSHYMNLFYDFILEYSKGKNIIIEGSHFATYIDYSKIENKKIIIKRTSFLKSIIRRLKRNIKYIKKEYKERNISIFTYIRKSFALIKHSITHSKKWYTNMNQFIEKITKKEGKNNEEERVKL